MAYKAIGFDWGGVLNGKPGKYFGQEVSNLLGITHDEYLEAYFKHNKKINRGEITWEELWKLVLTDIGQPGMVPQVMEISKAANSDNLNEDVLDIVDKLKSNGYKVGLLSNNTIDKAQNMRNSGLNTHFDVFHISEETGLVKPEPESFYKICRDLKVDPKEFIFVDDSEKSLSTSKEVGYTPVLFESKDQLVEELKKLGIKI